MPSSEVSTESPKNKNYFLFENGMRTGQLGYGFCQIFYFAKTVKVYFVDTPILTATAFAVRSTKRYNIFSIL